HIAEEARVSLEQVERLVGVVDDLLAAARRTDGGTTEPLELAEIFEQQQREWGPTFRRAGRPLEFGDAEGVKVLATPGALTQALSTLLENSLKYGDGTTSVRVRPSKSGSDSGVVIEVADEGQGVSDELAPRIFERHVTSGKGTGLGLGLARDLVAADGGRLELAQRRPAVFAIFLAAVPKGLDPSAVLPPGSMVVVGRRRGGRCGSAGGCLGDQVGQLGRPRPHRPVPGRQVDEAQRGVVAQPGEERHTLLGVAAVVVGGERGAHDGARHRQPARDGEPQRFGDRPTRMRTRTAAVLVALP